jgi:saccharopine dehydrogenase-like NADP-dependent oxidoreductase
MKQILLFGAGKSATVLIEYLLSHAASNGWELTVVDSNLDLAKSKIRNSPYGFALSFDINDISQREEQVEKADVVISMLPAALHFLVAKDCVKFSKHLLTASYVDDSIRGLEAEINQRGLLFLCEMGLDPGIDHMSAMRIIDSIHSRGGNVTSFKSHCGGLVAPESDDNPWHYKISWNPRNIVLAGKAGAHYLEHGEEVRLKYEQLFSTTALDVTDDKGSRVIWPGSLNRFVQVPGLGVLCWYPNRDSLGYVSLYGLEGASTFIRTTLRHPDFMVGWENIVELHLTDETPSYPTDGRSLADALKEHLDKQGFNDWLQRKMSSRLTETEMMLSNLAKLAEAEQEAAREGARIPESFMAADAKGNLEEIEIRDMKSRAAAFVSNRMHEANLTLKQLMFLGLDDQRTIVNRGLCSAADLLQFAMENKMSIGPADRDIIVMVHEISYELGGEEKQVTSSLVIKGDDGLHTAMAKTVGLPLGIATRLILDGTISTRGLKIPTGKAIYEPVLDELEQNGIRFQEY